MNPNCTKNKIIVVGCGVVGALIAYELSHQLTTAEIHVIDKQAPAQGSTGAALGVLMGIISHKVKGRTWRLREASVRRYRTLIQELKENKQIVPFNQQGILSLCFEESKLPRWETLKEKRIAQGWPLEIWTPEQLSSRCPHIALTSQSSAGTTRTVKAAIYSPADAQVNPIDLTQALVTRAKARGVTFHFNTEVTQLNIENSRCTGLQTTAPVEQRAKQKAKQTEEMTADWVVLSAGLGSAALTNLSNQASNQAEPEPLALMPVLGQAMRVKLPEVLGDRTFQPVINGDDIQFVPQGDGHYWLGATVEFPAEDAPTTPAELDPKGLDNLLAGAARFCPALQQAEIVSTWQGIRPRPIGQPAPVIKPLGDLQNITLATGHYRNGVLLAPATALKVCELLKAALQS